MDKLLEKEDNIEFLKNPPNHPQFGFGCYICVKHIDGHSVEIKEDTSRYLFHEDCYLDKVSEKIQKDSERNY